MAGLIPYPQIVYNPGTGPVTVAFTYPPVSKPGPHDGSSDERQAVRVDSITMSGKKQSFWVRTDKFRTLEMKNVPMTDLPAWAAFFDYALEGGEFDYYPDSSNLLVLTTYTLEDTSWKPAFAFISMSSFTMQMRQAV